MSDFSKNIKPKLIKISLGLNKPVSWKIARELFQYLVPSGFLDLVNMTHESVG